jgi:Cu2+-exporting ATPase
MHCFHCELAAGGAARRSSLLLGEERDFCCGGCEAAAHAIVDGGFGRYYESRLQPAAAPAAFAQGIALANSGEASFILERVTCAACLWLIERVLRASPGVTRADVNFTTRRAHVTWNPAASDPGRIVAALRKVGYDATPYDPSRQQQADERERRTALWRLFVAAFGAMQVMMYAFPAYIGAGDLSAEAAQMMRWASLLITLPVLVFACQPFFAGASRELAGRRIGLETPIALGLAGGFVASAWATIAGTGEVYFDSISMLAFLLLAARYAESAARRRAAASLDRLLGWTPSQAFAAGERVSVAPGERFPADGVVEAGASSADESLLTGESRPLAKRAGDAVVAGSVNLEQPLVIRVTRAGADTQAAAIARLAERAAASRPRLVEAADRIAAVLTPLALVVAAAAGLWWRDAWIAVAVLVAACPCALALAAPIVLTRANAAALSKGVLITRSSAHEALARVTDIVIDKTGTLTSGDLVVTQTFGATPDAGDLAAALEGSSRHPIARAFGSSRLQVDSPRHFAGAGIEGTIGGRRLRIGSRKFCAAIAGAACEWQANVYLAGEGEWLAAFELAEAVRPDAQALVDELKARRIEIHLASGDEPRIVAALARRLGIASWRGALMPQAKHDLVAYLQATGRTVAMVGDGLNDTPGLARGDVSFAMGAGADAAQLSADAVLTGNRLAAVAETLDLSRRAMDLVRGGFAWALAYNAAVLPLAALGLVGPWEAALGMGASSILVMLNASRPLARTKPWKASTSSSPSPSPSYS